MQLRMRGVSDRRRVITWRRWVSAYAVRIGPAVNLFTLIGFAIGNLIWVQIDEDSTLRDGFFETLAPWIGFSVIACMIAAAVALLLGHLLFSVPWIRGDVHRMKIVFEVTAVVVVTVPVMIGLYLTAGWLLAVPCGLFLAVSIVGISRLIVHHLPKYPSPLAPR